MTDDVSILFTPIDQALFLVNIEAIARQMEADDWQPHFIVGIGRGGLVPGTFLSHRVGIPLLSIDHSSRVHPFSEALLLRIAQQTRAGERYLFVDDINDSGKTILHFRGGIADHGEPVNVRFAALISNMSSATSVDYAARTIDRRVDKDWFIFPWEAMAPREALAMDAIKEPDRLSLDPKGTR